jgi:hypothetical protein
MHDLTTLADINPLQERFFHLQCAIVKTRPQYITTVKYYSPKKDMIMNVNYCTFFLIITQIHTYNVITDVESYKMKWRWTTKRSTR